MVEPRRGLPHSISKRSMCRPTRRPYRGRLKWLGEMSEEYAQLLHRGSGGGMYTRKAHATREAPRRGQRWPTGGPGGTGWAPWGGGEVRSNAEAGERQWQEGDRERKPL